MGVKLPASQIRLLRDLLRFFPFSLGVRMFGLAVNYRALKGTASNFIAARVVSLICGVVALTL